MTLSFSSSLNHGLVYHAILLHAPDMCRCVAYLYQINNMLVGE